MPLYNVEHSYPLNLQQKTDLATRITKLHAHTFTTPSMFVQVKFQRQDASAQEHFVAGVLAENSVNRIIGYVRSSSSRTKEHWDKLGKQMEHAWYVVVGEARDEDDEEEETKDGEKKKKEPFKSDSNEIEKKAKELLAIAFVTGIVVREKGYAIPDAGGEEAWIKQFRKEFEKKADSGDASFAGMLSEIEKRDDLKAWRGSEKYQTDEEKKAEEKKAKEKEKEAEELKVAEKKESGGNEAGKDGAQKNEEASK